VVVCSWSSWCEEAAGGIWVVFFFLVQVEMVDGKCDVRVGPRVALPSVFEKKREKVVVVFSFFVFMKS
jgi:hypothetical protein